MPRGDPKVSRTYRLEAVLIERVEERAREEGIFATAFLERALEHELDRRDGEVGA